ncbi:MAG: hypothetical protein AB7Q69_13775 [Gemmatimonadales bacterium]
MFTQRLVRLSAVLAILGGGLSCGSDTQAPSLPAGDIQIVRDAATKGANAFNPPGFSVSLAAQSNVTWVNADADQASGYVSGVTHKIISDDGTTFASGNIPPGGTFKALLTTPGTYPYHCAIHPTMTGTLTVTP